MPTEVISIGPVFTMTQNVIYSLPAPKVLLFTDAVMPTIQQSTDVAFTANVAVVLTAGQAELAGGFIRLITAGPIRVVLKRA